MYDKNGINVSSAYEFSSMNKSRVSEVLTISSREE